MKISHRYKFVFISNPKCASMSIREALYDFSDIHDNDDRNDIFFHHSPASRLKRYFEENHIDWDDYYKFSTIRNPWERLVSQYFYCETDKNGNNFWDNGYDIKSKYSIDFKTWIKSYISKTIEIMNTKYFVCDEYGNLLINELFKVEELDQGFAFICKRIGIPKMRLKRVNTTQHNHYTKYYDDECVQLVADFFSFDISIGNYKYGQ